VPKPKRAATGEPRKVDGLLDAAERLGQPRRPKAAKPTPKPRAGRDDLDLGSIP